MSPRNRSTSTTVAVEETSHAAAEETSRAAAEETSHAVAEETSHAVAEEASHAVAEEASHAVAEEASHAVAEETSHVSALDDTVDLTPDANEYTGALKILASKKRAGSNNMKKTSKKTRSGASRHNSFMLYVKDKRPVVRQVSPHLRTIEISKVIGEMWTKEPDHVKASYKEKAAELNKLNSASQADSVDAS